MDLYIQESRLLSEYSNLEDALMLIFAMHELTMSDLDSMTTDKKKYMEDRDKKLTFHDYDHEDQYQFSLENYSKLGKEYRKDLEFLMECLKLDTYNQKKPDVELNSKKQIIKLCNSIARIDDFKRKLSERANENKDILKFENQTFYNR